MLEGEGNNGCISLELIETFYSKIEVEIGMFPI